MANKDKQAEQSAQGDAKALPKALWAAMLAAVDLQINGDRKHGWGGEDSFVVIEAIVAEDASLAEGAAKNYTLSEPASKLIRLWINPSAARQNLEKDTDLGKARLDVVENKRKGSLKGLAAEFGS